MGVADDRIRQGDLDGARAALVEAVRDDPGNAAARLALAEILVVAGDLTRADTHLDAAQNLDVSYGVAVALGRQLIRAAVWRGETFTAGRPPDLVTPRTAAIDAGLAAILAARTGDPFVADEAAATVGGTIDDRPFTGWYDGDERTAGVLEVLTSTGTYLWIPFEHLRGLRLLPVKRLRDTVWRPAEVDVASGPSGAVYLPVIYDAAEPTSLHRLGRATDWSDSSPICGRGLRTWLIGDEAVTTGDFVAITVDA